MMNLLTVVCVVILVQACRTAPLSCDEKTQYSKDEKCCKLCAPGERLKAECTSNTETQCELCKDEEYQPKYNKEKNCMMHTYCDRNAGFYIAHEGNKITDNECRCTDTHHCSGAACETCIPNTLCSAGLKVKTKSDGIKDTECETCPEGSFSNGSSNEVCTPWTRCEDIGQTQEMPGSPTNDTVCVLKKNTSSGVSLGVAIGFVLLVIIIFAVFICLCKKQWYDKKKIQNPDPQQPEKQNLKPEENGLDLAAENDENCPVPESRSDRNLPVRQEHGKDSHMSEEATNSLC